MSKARDLARLSPNASGLLPNANIEAVAASKLTGQVLDANAPSGSVIQVVHATDTPTFNSSSTSFVDYPSMSATITPINASNRVLILMNYGGYVEAGGGDNGFRCQILRNSTAILSDNNHTLYIYSPDGAEMILRHSLSYVDSPSSTSAVTYKLQIAATAGSAFRNYDNNRCSITLMEIAA